MFHVLNSLKNIEVGHFTRRPKLPHSTLRVVSLVSWAPRFAPMAAMYYAHSCLHVWIQVVRIKKKQTNKQKNIALVNCQVTVVQP